MMHLIEKYAQAAASTARTPLNSPARRAADEKEMALRAEVKKGVADLEAERAILLHPHLSEREDWVLALVRDICEHWIDERDVRRLRATITHAIGEARREGAEAMQAQCAQVCDVTPPHPFRPSIEAAHAIRRLHFDRRMACLRDEVINPVWTALFSGPVPAIPDGWKLVPVYLVATGLTHEDQELYTRHDEPVPMADNENLYAAAPEHKA